MRIHVSLLTILLLATGCTHQRAVTLTEAESVRSLNQRAGQHAVTVELADGAVYYGRAFQMAADSTSWLMRDSHEVKSVATKDVVAVEIRNSGRGALEGLAAGAIAGSLVGVALGLIAGDDPACDNTWFCISLSAEEKAQISGVLLGTVSGLGGLIRGAIRGSRDVYRFDATEMDGHRFQEQDSTPDG